MAEASPVTPAPGELEFVRAFVNTLDIEAGTDVLADAEEWRVWAAGQSLEASADAAQLSEARELREALRAALIANHDRAPLPPETIAALDRAADRARPAVRFTPDGARLAPPERGMPAVYGRIVASVASALQDGSWSRLKACASDACRWGFYDTSRSRTGQWCAMAICGNRAKQARWRQQAATPAR
ncbi:CGNR zinc finger domain-containing protein [Microbacterium sp. P04]|uniref:CGNR zinc finger domain-containing protein n=1 Tax=Microbacterium sp. P04 TaxID=3366947 RepID=UPI003746C873